MEHGAVLGDVDVVAAEHGIDPLAQPAGLGQGHEEAHRLVGDAVLGVVEVQPGPVGDEPLAPVRVVGEEVPQVPILQLLVVRTQRRPLGPFDEPGHERPHTFPAAVVTDHVVGVGRPPGALGVGVHGRRVVEDRVDDPPQRGDVDLGREQQLVAVHGVGEQALVGRQRRLGAALGHQRHVLTLAVVRVEDLGADRDAHLVADGERDGVGLPAEDLGEDILRRWLQVDRHLRRLHGQALAGPDEDRHAGPAPGVQAQADRHVGLRRRTPLHALHPLVPAVLAPHDVVGGQGPDRLEHPQLRPVHGVGRPGRRRIHGEQGDHLEEVVLHDVADGPVGVVEGASVVDPEVLGHRDLDALDVVAVHQRLHEAVGEPEVHEVLDGFLPEEVVDAVDVVLAEHRGDRLVELLGAGAVVTERLLDDDAAAVGAARRLELLDDQTEQRRRDGQVVQRVGGLAELAPQLGEGLGVAVVAVDVAQQRHQLRERHVVDAVLGVGQAVAGPLLQLVERPAVQRHAHDGHLQLAVLRPWPAGRGRSACRRGRRSHRRRRGRRRGRRARPGGVVVGSCVRVSPAGFSWCPPNSYRMAESTLSAKSAWPRELNRS